MTLANHPAATPCNAAGPAADHPPHGCCAMPLPSLQSRQCGTILHISGPEDEDAARLKQLGLCTGRRVALMRGGDPMILQVMGSRLGICASLAQRVVVQPCGGLA